MQPEARRARALLEPLVYRGVEPVQGEILLVGETEIPTRDAVVSRADAVAVEFRIRHE